MADSIPLIHSFDPDKPLVLMPTGVICQQDWLSTCLRLAQCLPQQRYIINLCHDRYQFLLLFSAGLVGHKTALLPPNRQVKTIADIQQDYPDSICISDQPSNYAGLDILDIADLLSGPPQVSDDLSVPIISANHTAAVAFTSGSTGKPNPVAKAWRTLVGTGEKIANRFQLDKSKPVILATVPSQHMYGLENTVMLVLHGYCAMSNAQPFYPDDIVEQIDKIRQPILLVTTPVHLRSLVESGKIIQRPLAGVISATAPLADDLAVDAEKILRTQVQEIYGCTEAGSMATRRTVAGPRWQMLDGMRLQQNGDGIAILGDQLTADAHVQDNIQLLSNDSFKFLGRKSDMVILAGKRSSLTELNHKLLSIPGIDDAIVYLPSDDNKSIVRPCAYVVSQLTVADITQQASKLMDPVFVPRPIRKVPRLPRNETGKITQAILQQLAGKSCDE